MFSGIFSCVCTQVRLDFLYPALNLCDEFWPFDIIFWSSELPFPSFTCGYSSSPPDPPPFHELPGGGISFVLHTLGMVTMP